MHALGPKAEGAELKIVGKLSWPPVLARPAPPGQLQQPGPRLGHFRNTFSSSDPGNPKTVPPRRSELGAGQQAEGWGQGGPHLDNERPGQDGPWPSHPCLFSPTGSKPRTSGWGSKCSPNLGGPPLSPPSPPGGGLYSSPVGSDHPPLPHHTVPSMSLTCLFSPLTPPASPGQ